MQILSIIVSPTFTTCSLSHSVLHRLVIKSRDCTHAFFGDQRLRFETGARGQVDRITELRKRGDSPFAMSQANIGAAGANEAVPQVDGAAIDGAVPLMNGAVLPQMDVARVRGAVQAAAPVAGPLIALLVAVPLFPQGPVVAARFDVDGALLGPLPTKSNKSCKIFPKIEDETGP